MIDDVRAAQGGDLTAFARLVARYRSAAVTYARRWVGDAEAEDAAQDAFIDVHRGLAQLREPAAFPGWLRRVVRKHCDRRTRRARLDFTTDWSESEAPSDDVPLAVRADAQRVALGLRRELSQLPEHERTAVALHYLAEMPVAEIAQFLDVSPAAVKKRLQRGRARLTAVETPAPLRVDGAAFDRPIQLFLAVLAGDRAKVAAVLDAAPDLVNRPESWSDAQALTGRFPLAHARTPLMAAAGRGDAEMVRLLLERGAEVNAACGCAQGETALFTAALRGFANVVELLRAAGADAEVRNAAGLSAREVAVQRGHVDVLRALGEPDPDRHAPARAAERLEAQPAASPSERPEDGAPDDLGADASETDRLGISQSATEGSVRPTGITAIDLLAPLGSTALVRVAGEAETGLMVLLAELSRRWGAVGGHAVWTTGDDTPAMWGDLAAFARETGVERCVTVCGPDALAVAEQKNGGGAAALFVFVPEDRRADVDVALPRLRAAAARVFVVEPWTAFTRGEPLPERLLAPWDAQIVTSRERAARGVYPALDYHRTASRTPVAARHARHQAWARQHPAEAERVLAQRFPVWSHQPT